MKNANWDKSIRSASKLISLFRQFVVCEYDGSRLYSHVESLADGCSVDYILARIEQIGTEQEKNQFNEILGEAGSFLPYAASIHNFLRKHDQKWYYNQPALTQE